MEDTHATTENFSGMADLMRSRATMYGLIARLFEREINADLLEQLRAMHYPQNSDNDIINQAFRNLYGYLRHARENVLSELAVDYARTFLGSGILNGNAAFPYESVYTSEHALLMQEARDEVLAAYRRNNVNTSPDWTDPEDHLALELDFMRELCLRTAEALEAPSSSYSLEDLIGTQYSFLKLHPLRWVDRFCTDVKRFSTTNFYKAIAQLTPAYIEDDIVLLEDIAEASSIDLRAALDSARAADEAITAEMAAEAAKEHLIPNVIVSADEEGNLVASPLAPEDAAELLTHKDINQ